MANGPPPETHRKDDNCIVLVSPNEIRYVRANLVNQTNLKSNATGPPAATQARGGAEFSAISSLTNINKPVTPSTLLQLQNETTEL